MSRRLHLILLARGAARLGAVQRQRSGLLLLLALGALGGCAHRMRSAMYLPCKTREITVSEEVYAPNEETWVASCRGHDYGCWSTAEGSRVKYGCKAMRRSAKRSSAAGARADGS